MCWLLLGPACTRRAQTSCQPTHRHDCFSIQIPLPSHVSSAHPFPLERRRARLRDEAAVTPPGLGSNHVFRARHDPGQCQWEPVLLNQWWGARLPTKRCRFNPESGRSPGGGHGNPLQHSCLENPMDRGACWATVHGVTKSRTQLKQLSMHALLNVTRGLQEPRNAFEMLVAQTRGQRSHCPSHPRGSWALLTCTSSLTHTPTSSTQGFMRFCVSNVGLYALFSLDLIFSFWLLEELIFKPTLVILNFLFSSRPCIYQFLPHILFGNYSVIHFLLSSTEHRFIK